MEQVYIVIPAFCPDRELCRRVEEIRLTVPSEIVIVDDGSGEEFIGIFRQLRESDGCTVLSHDKNRGKGAALKTAFQYIKEKEETGNKILCIDCDGQHLPEDGRKLLTRLGEHPEALILGGGTFPADIFPGDPEWETECLPGFLKLLPELDWKIHRPDSARLEAGCWK